MIRPTSIALLLLAPLTALAGRADGYALPDADERARCQARQRQDPGQCYAIQNPDRRSACLAEFRQDRYLCSSLSDAGERARCEQDAQRH